MRDAVADIVWTLPDGTERTVPLRPSAPLIAGRAKDCPIRLAGDSMASRRHCAIEWCDGRVTVIDLDSRNGIRVNERRVTEEALGPDDVLRVGGSLVRVRLRPGVTLAGTVLEVEPGFCAGCGRLVGVGREPGASHDGEGGVLCRACTEVGPRAPRVPGYRVIRELGAGLMGRVYHARDEQDGTEVALKILAPKVPPASVREAIARFVRECKAMEAIEHPGAVRYVASGEAEGFHFLAMEYVDGADLQSVLNERGALPVMDAIDAALAVLDCLAHAHAKGILHRDLKPANIFRARADGFIKLADFGLAHLAEETGLSVRSMSAVGMGSPAFAPPEQIMALDQTSGRSDLYGTAATLYTLLTARLPFQGRNIPDTVVKVLEEPAPDVRVVRPEVPAAVAAVIARAMEKDPADRYARAEEMREALWTASGR